jgi:hypothetical protein
VPSFPDILPTETPRAYEAFTWYCGAGPGRSLDKVSQEHTKSIPVLKKWSAEHAWVARVARYDAAVSRERAAQLDAARRADIERLREQSQNDAKVLRGLALRAAKVLDKRLAALDSSSIEPQQIAGLLRSITSGLEGATNLDAAALGVDDILRHLEGLSDGDDDTDEPSQAAQRVGG